MRKKEEMKTDLKTDLNNLRDQVKKMEDTKPLTRKQLHYIFDSVKAVIIMSGDTELARELIEEVGQDTLDTLNIDDQIHYEAVVRLIDDMEEENLQTLEGNNIDCKILQEADSL